MSLLLIGAGAGVNSSAHAMTAVGIRASSGLKPVLKGLLVRQRYPGLPKEITQVGGLVVSVGWKDIQPAQGGPIAPNNKIDQAIAYARLHSLGVRLHVTAGIQAPNWAKSIGGTQVPVYGPNDSSAGTIGRFWTDAFGQAYNELQVKLAARYDNTPELAEVDITRCTTIYPEPFIRQGSSVLTVHSLLAAGYSVAADGVCQQQQIDAHKVWLTARSSLALNPYDHINSDGKKSFDLAFTEQMMLYCRQQLGAGCVLGNASVRWPVLNGQYRAMYSYVQSLGPPISYETANPPQIGDAIQAIKWSATVGANSVELPKVMPGVSLKQLDKAAAALKLNPTGP